MRKVVTGAMLAPISARTDVVVNGVVAAIVHRVVFAIGGAMGGALRPLVREEPKEELGATPTKVNASRDAAVNGARAVVVVPLQFLPLLHHPRSPLPPLPVAFATGEAMGRALRPLARVSSLFLICFKPVLLDSHIFFSHENNPIIRRWCPRWRLV